MVGVRTIIERGVQMGLRDQDKLAFLGDADDFAAWCGVADPDDLDRMTWQDLEELPGIKTKSLYISGPGTRLEQRTITWQLLEDRPEYCLFRRAMETQDRFIGRGDTVSAAALQGLITAWEMIGRRGCDVRGAALEET